MKFLNDEDNQSVIAEARDANLPLDEYVIKRGGVLKRFKNHKQSRAAKQAWRRNRLALMKGIKRFHKSTTGKRFHRSLGQFLSMRSPLYKSSIIQQHNLDVRKSQSDIQQARQFINRRENLSESEMYSNSVVLNSLRTHLVLEKTYILPFAEQLEFDALFEEVLPLLDGMIIRVQNGYEITEDDFILLNDLYDGDILERV